MGPDVKNFRPNLQITPIAKHMQKFPIDKENTNAGKNVFITKITNIHLKKSVIEKLLFGKIVYY